MCTHLSSLKCQDRRLGFSSRLVPLKRRPCLTSRRSPCLGLASARRRRPSSRTQTERRVSSEPGFTRLRTAPSLRKLTPNLLAASTRAVMEMVMEMRQWRKCRRSSMSPWAQRSRLPPRISRPPQGRLSPRRRKLSRRSMDPMAGPRRTTGRFRSRSTTRDGCVQLTRALPSLLAAAVLVSTVVAHPSLSPPSSSPSGARPSSRSRPLQLLARLDGIRMAGYVRSPRAAARSRAALTPRRRCTRFDRRRSPSSLAPLFFSFRRVLRRAPALCNHWRVWTASGLYGTYVHRAPLLARAALTPRRRCTRFDCRRSPSSLAPLFFPFRRVLRRAPALCNHWRVWTASV